MGYITPKTDWAAGNGIGLTDMNRIEGNILYLREEDATLNGIKTFNDNIKVAENSDASVVLGRARVGSLSGGIADYAYFGHYDTTETDNTFAVRQGNSTTNYSTTVNAGSGGSVRLRVNDSNAATFSSSEITLDSFTYIPGTSGELLRIGFNTDVSVDMGRGRLGFANGGTADTFYISHRDNFNATEFGILLNTSNTLINAANIVQLGVNGGNVLRVESSKVTITKPTFINNIEIDNSTERVGLMKVTSTTGSGYVGMSAEASSASWSYMGNSTIGGIYEEDSAKWHLQCVKSGGSILLYNGANRLETIGSGVNITGDANISGEANITGDLNPSKGVSKSGGTSGNNEPASNLYNQLAAGITDNNSVLLIGGLRYNTESYIVVGARYSSSASNVLISVCTVLGITPSTLTITSTDSTTASWNVSW